jgi:hypothetical protein
MICKGASLAEVREERIRWNRVFRSPNVLRRDALASVRDDIVDDEELGLHVCCVPKATQNSKAELVGPVVEDRAE